MEYVTLDGITATTVVAGRYDLTRTVGVTRELLDAINNGAHKVVIDFGKTTYIDSSALRDLARVRNRVGKANFYYKNAAGDILTALQISRLDESWNKAE